MFTASHCTRQICARYSVCQCNKSFFFASLFSVMQKNDIDFIIIFVYSSPPANFVVLYLPPSPSVSFAFAFVSLNITFSPYTHFIFILKPSLMKMTFIISLFSRILMALNDFIREYSSEEKEQNTTKCFTIYTHRMGTFLK